MEKRTLYALVAFVVFGLGAFLVMRAPEKGQRSGPRARPLNPPKAADVVHLDITTDKGENVSLEKSGSAWRIQSPKDWPADQAAVKSLVDGLEKMTFGDLVTESKDKHEEMGVADGKASHVVAKGQGNKILADLYVGKSVGGFTMARLGKKNEVWQSSGLFQYLVNKDAKAWRDHIIFEFAANEADKLTVEGGGSTLSLSKIVDAEKKDAKAPNANDAKWKIDSASGDAPKTSGALDVAMVNSAVQALSTLRAADFADDKKPADVGMNAPPLKLTVQAAGKPHKLFFGETNKDDVYVQAEGNPTVFVVKKSSSERLSHRPADYRDKTLAKVKEVDLSSIDLVSNGESISLTHAGDKWKSQKPIDDAKVKPLVSSFENLAGSGFAQEKDPVKAGLKKPTGSVTLHLKDKSTITLKIGAANKEGSDYFVQKVGSPDVLLVKKYMVDRFLKKPADLAPGAAAKSAKPAAPTKTAAATPKKKK
jgi:hypothetical protein